MDNKGRSSERGDRFRYRVHVSEVYSRLETQAKSAPSLLLSQIAKTSTAQLNSVFSGLKPAFAETIPGFSASFAEELPAGCYYAAASSGVECIYNAAAVAKECGLPLGANVRDYVLQVLENGTYGRILGYGMDTIHERPCHLVLIQHDGDVVFGFMTSPHIDVAMKYAAAEPQSCPNARPPAAFLIFDFRFLICK